MTEQLFLWINVDDDSQNRRATSSHKRFWYIIMAEKNSKWRNQHGNADATIPLLSGPGDKWRLIEDEEMNNMKRAHHTNDARVCPQAFWWETNNKYRKKKKTTAAAPSKKLSDHRANKTRRWNYKIVSTWELVLTKYHYMWIISRVRNNRVVDDVHACRIRITEKKQSQSFWEPIKWFSLVLTRLRSRILQFMRSDMENQKKNDETTIECHCECGNPILFLLLNIKVSNCSSRSNLELVTVLPKVNRVRCVHKRSDICVCPRQSHTLMARQLTISVLNWSRTDEAERSLKKIEHKGDDRRNKKELTWNVQMQRAPIQPFVRHLMQSN